MAEMLALWSHALAALLFAAVALWTVRARGGPLPYWPLLAMAATTIVWALAVAGLGGADSATRLADGLRNLAMLALLFAIHRRGGEARSAGIATVFAVVAAVMLAGIVVQLVAAAVPATALGTSASEVALLLRMMTGVAALVLVRSVHSSADRSALRLAAIGVGLAWFAEVNLATTAYLTNLWRPEYVAVRGLVAAGAAAILAIALERGDRPGLRVSRTVAYQAIGLAAASAYVTLLALVGDSLASVGGESGRIYQTAFVVGLTAAALTLASSSWLRAWIKVKVSKHLFTHRYDYRAEWLRFTATLGDAAGATPLAERCVQAIANLTMSPGGLLLVPEGSAGLGLAARVAWTGEPGPIDVALAGYLGSGDRIVALDAVRRGQGAAAELAAIPQWLIDDGSVWAIVPLFHGEALVGAIVLARPAVDRALDWEDFDLLKVAGRQVASYLSEARARDALAEGQRFDEFNRRFAFIVHDIKNLTSGLTLVARNAERHADNPAFRADMVATLQDSAAKLNALLARLSANARGPTETAVAVPLLDFAERFAAARRAVHPIVVGGDPGAVALVGRARLEQVVAHLVSNAVEASPRSEPIMIEVTQCGDHVALSVRDAGCGMTAEFIRDQLFRPFVSSKPAGFGIGAFEARQLAEAMGGRIEVDSRVGHGSTFRVILPAALAYPIEVAA